MTDPGGSRETGSLDTAIGRVTETHDALRRENLAAVDPRQVAFEQAVMGLLATLNTREKAAYARGQTAERRRCAAIVRARVEAPIGALENARSELTDVLADIESEPPAASSGDAALPRTPETVLRASVARLRNAINNPPDGDDDTWKSAMRAALRELEAAISGIRPLDAPPMEAP